MTEQQPARKKGITRIIFSIVLGALLVASLYLIYFRQEYLIGISLLGLSAVYLIADIQFYITDKKATTIIPFEPKYQRSVDKMMREIQNEFDEIMSPPGSKTLTDLYKDRHQQFWVALKGEKVVGTVGIFKMKDNNAALKRLMVAKDFRGEKNISKSLLDTSIVWSKENGISTIYLGTMSQMKAAHNFYEKHGFSNIDEMDLPANFPANTVDTVFYKLSI